MSEYKNDFIIILILVFIALSVFMLYSNLINSDRNADNHVEINVNGELFGSYSLLIDTVVPVETEYGYNLIEIKDGKVFVNDADCPDKLCVNRGKISENGQQVVCLPNRLTVKISKFEDAGEYDAIAY